MPCFGGVFNKNSVTFYLTLRYTYVNYFMRVELAHWQYILQFDFENIIADIIDIGFK